jgi:hypothetical protein
VGIISPCSDGGGQPGRTLRRTPCSWTARRHRSSCLRATLAWIYGLPKTWLAHVPASWASATQVLQLGRATPRIPTGSEDTPSHALGAQAQILRVMVAACRAVVARRHQLVQGFLQSEQSDTPSSEPRPHANTEQITTETASAPTARTCVATSSLHRSQAFPVDPAARCRLSTRKYVPGVQTHSASSSS